MDSQDNRQHRIRHQQVVPSDSAAVAPIYSGVDIAATLDKYGRIDVLINNAAVFASIPRRQFYDIPFDEWNKVLHVNVTGSYLCASAAAPAMRKAGQGRIINISSGTVPQGAPGSMHYVTSKAAVVGMTRVMARELGDDNINVNAVMPGYTETEIEHASMDEGMHQFIQQKRILKRPETPDDLIGTCCFWPHQLARLSPASRSPVAAARLCSRRSVLRR